jgi:large subunit ribosomal protein L31
MKTGIHPNYQAATVTCACGNTFQTRSTRREIRTDICGVCHPFYTGEQRIIDTAGQVERFMRRMEASQSATARPSKRQARLQVRSTAAAEEQARQREAQARERAAEAAARRERRAAEAGSAGEAEPGDSVETTETADAVELAEQAQA